MVEEEEVRPQLLPMLPRVLKVVQVVVVEVVVVVVEADIVAVGGEGIGAFILTRVEGARIYFRRSRGRSIRGGAMG